MHKLQTLFFLVLFLAVLATVPAYGAAVITNGQGIYLGVNDQGHLDYTDGITTSVNAYYVGVSIYADLSAYGHGVGLQDATAPGCLCEGWGAAATPFGGSPIGGGADVSVGGIDNLGLVSFTSTASTATSVTTLGGTTLQITQAYGPSTSNSLMLDTVTLTNMGTDPLGDVRYRRVMDWDVPPTEFYEYVTIGGWPATNLLLTTDNGFQSPNPLVGDAGIGCPVNANFEYCGPWDHGALFDFGFGDLAAGESKSFDIFYGATFSHDSAVNALASVGAEVYSFGNWGYDSTRTGQPITYIFGFKGVGGTPITGVPEPTSILLLGSVGAFLLYARRRRA